MIGKKLPVAFKATGSEGIILLLHFVFEELDGFDEGALSSSHDHIYRIEVFSAIEASGEVGLRVDCGVEVLTEGTSEPQ